MNEKGLWWQRVLDACHLHSPKPLCGIRSHRQDQSHPGKENPALRQLVNQWCPQRKMFRDKGQLSERRKLTLGMVEARSPCTLEAKSDSGFQANMVLRDFVSNPVTKVEIFYASLQKLKAEGWQRKVSYAWPPDINWMFFQHGSHLSPVYGIWFRKLHIPVVSMLSTAYLPKRLMGKNKMVKM